MRTNALPAIAEPAIAESAISAEQMSLQLRAQLLYELTAEASRISARNAVAHAQVHRQDNDRSLARGRYLTGERAIQHPRSSTFDPAVHESQLRLASLTLLGSVVTR